MRLSSLKAASRRLAARSTIVLLACLLTCLPEASFAWDHSRQGFLLGAGLGVGGNLGDSVNFGGVAGDLILGYAPSDRWSIHYTGKTILGSGGGVYPMLGATWWRQPSSPSWFLTGGLGVVGVSNGEGEVGAGGYIGAGLEFRQHYSFEFDVIPYGYAGGVGVALMGKLHVLGY